RLIGFDGVHLAGVSVRARLTADHGLALGVCAKHKWKSNACSDNKTAALVAQLDRAPDFESGGRGFESLRARQRLQGLSCYFAEDLNDHVRGMSAIAMEPRPGVGWETKIA